MTFPRKRTWVLLVPLALLALGSVLGVVALGLERRGLIRLHRVPSPILMCWSDERGSGIAIVNTDSTPGLFWILAAMVENPQPFGWPGGFIGERGHEPPSSGERVWVPSRSIVICPRVDVRQQIRLYDSVGSLGWLVDDDSHAIPRGTSFAVRWAPSAPGTEARRPDSFCFLKHDAAFHVIERPGIERIPGKRRFDCEPWFDWDGKTPIVVDIDRTTGPEISTFRLAAVSDGESVGISEWVWAYPPDMTVIDERPSK